MLKFFLQLMVFGFYRNYSKDMKISSVILIFYQFIIDGNMILGYVMVKFLGVKIDSVPIEQGFFLIGLTIAINYILQIMIIFLAMKWRFKLALEVLMELQEFKDKNVMLKRLKTVIKIWSKLGDLVAATSKYFLMCNIFLFLIIFMMYLITLFLAYDILMHELGSDNLILFYSFIVFTCSYTHYGVVITISSVYFSNCFSSAINNLNLIALKIKEKKIQKFCSLAVLQLTAIQKEISCGLFEFNWKFIFLLISSVFSYLVTMMQFDYMLTLQNIKIVP